MPTPPDWGSFQVGSAQYPLAATSPNPPLQDVDPALFYALGFWASVITTYVGPRLMTEAAALGFTWTGPIVQQYPYDVGPNLTELQGQFPMLAAWRKSTDSKRITSGYAQDDTKFSVAYIFPPLTAAQCERLIPFLHAIAVTLRNRTDQAWDPSYTPPGGTGPLPGPFSSAFSYIKEIGFQDRNSFEFGVMPGVGNLSFPMMLGHGYIIERDNDVPDSFSGRQKFAGVDIEADLVASDLTTVPNLIDASTQQAPTITGLSVATGPIAGGTSVTLTGTLFKAAPTVLFGNTSATSIVWNSATSITCSTPAVSGPGTLSVIVVNQDSQVATLPAAFAFV